MANIFFKILILSIVISVNSSCGKLAESKKTVLNTSANDIKILIFDRTNTAEWKDSFSISPGQETIIERFVSDDGTKYNNGSNCARSSDSVYIGVLNNPELKVTKDLNNNNNWTFTSNSASRKIEVVCRATITDADIVPK